MNLQNYVKANEVVSNHTTIEQQIILL